jgi:hypothetical protein
MLGNEKPTGIESVAGRNDDMRGLHDVRVSSTSDGLICLEFMRDGKLAMGGTMTVRAAYRVARLLLDEAEEVVRKQDEEGHQA